MADRNINENIRKPRRAKGTPFFYQRNYYALGVILVSGATWYLYELWPQSKKLKQSVKEGKFKYSPEIQEHILTARYSSTDPALDAALSKV